MNKLNNTLKQIFQRVSGKQTIIFFIVFLLFTALVLPFISTLTTNVIGVSASPDTSFDYRLESIYNLMNQYGQDGRRFYVIMRWTFDIVWPLVYTLFLLSSTAYLARKTNVPYGYKLLYIPLFAVLFDLLENTNITILMLSYPTKIDIIGYFFFASSMLKWIGIACSFILITILAIYMIYKKARSK